MKRLYSYIFFFIALLFAIPSLKAQEQLTDFRGSPCCYSFEKIIPYDDFTYGLARDHQDGVRIYLLDKSEANLVFSNDQDDKISLIDHGLVEEFYYFIYQDRIELFRFSGGDIETYEFNAPLPLNRSRKEALSMSKYGLTIIPESETEPLQFYNLSTQRFETRSPSLNREHTRVQLDSFILFTTYENRQGKLFSHNILSDEVHFLHSGENEGIEFIPKNSLLFFGDGEELFVTKGQPNNTYFMMEYRSSMLSTILSYQRNNKVHILFEDYSDTLHYNKLDWNMGIVEDYLVPSDTFPSFIDHFYRINEDELLFMTPWCFTKVNMRNDSINKFEMRAARNLTLDSANVYFLERWLKSFNYETEEVSVLSETFISSNLSSLPIHKVNDSLFYFIGFSGSHQETNSGLIAFDLNAESMVELLSFGENGNGLDTAKLEKVGQKLLLRQDFKILEWTGQQFKNLFNSYIESPIIKHQDKYYFINYTHESRVSLNEWQDQNQIVKAVDGIPYNDYKGKVLSTSDQLFFINHFEGAYEINIESGTYDTLIPYNHAIMFYGAYPVGDYIIIDIENPGRGNEYWSYHINSKSWNQLEKGPFLRDHNNSLENPKHAGDYLLMKESHYPEQKLTSISMRTAEKSILLDRNNPGPNYRYYTVSNSCDGSELVHALDTDNDDHKLYVTDGTIDGTQQILDLDSENYFSSFYKFEGYLYFTAFDEEYTKAFRLNCENQQLEELEEFDPLIPQQHFRFGNQTYVLGYQYFPEENLSLNRVIGNQTQELRVSPYEIVPDYLGFFNNPKTRPIAKLGDSQIAISVGVDEKGEELWWISPDGQLKRITDLNPGPFDSEIKNLVPFGDYLYFTGYQYGAGNQVWRIPLPNSLHGENPKTLQLQIAPNPSESQLTIYNVPLEKGEVKIFDMSGKPVFEGIKNEGTPQFSHNMQPYPPGMYIVLLRVNDKLYSGKFILK